jgi:hypothetical protein
MSIELMLYLVGLLDNVTMWFAFAFVAFIGSAVGLFILHIDEVSGSQTSIQFCKKMLKYSTVLLLIFTILPTSKTAYLMLGAHIGKEVIQSESFNKVQKVIDHKLDEYLKEVE